MKKNIFKRIIVSVLTLSMIFSFSGFVSGASHAKNGANVVPSNLKWKSFSVRDDLHTGVNTPWEEDLCKAMDDAIAIKFAKSNFFKGNKGNYYTKVNNYKKTASFDPYAKIEENRNAALANAKADYDAGKMTEAQYNKLDQETHRKNPNDDKDPAGILDWQSWTHGIISNNESSNVTLDCSKTIKGGGSVGGDGEYSALTPDGDKVLTGDNPYGLHIEMEGIPVEFGRYYTLEYDIATDKLRDKNYNDIDKHYRVKAYDYQLEDGPAASFENVVIDGKEASTTGEYVIKAKKTSHVKATFKIPASKDEWSGGKNKEPYTYMGVMFALGAFDKTYKSESWSTGKFVITNLKVTAGTQYSVKYYDADGKTLKASKWVNEYEQAPNVALQKKGYTLTGYTDMATNAKYNFGSLVEKDLNLRANWIKTPKPKKASFTLKSKKKRKVTVKFKKNKNAVGYQVKYSHNKKFKKKAKYKTKTKNTSKTGTYTIKKVKSSRILYVKARAYNKDSCGRKIYGKWSKRKKVYVK